MKCCNNDCETVNHCLKHGCIPKQESESGKAAYQRGYLDGMAKPCVACADRQWVGLTQDEFRDFASTFEYGTGGLIRAVEAKLKEKNTC